MSKGRSKGQQQKAAGKDDWQKQQVKAFAKHKLTATSGKRELHRQPSTRHVLCCAVLCCAVLCCAVLCCAVLCCAMLCCAVLCCAVLCCAVLYQLASSNEA